MLKVLQGEIISQHKWLRDKCFENDTCKSSKSEILEALSTEQGLTSPPTQYRLYGRQFLQVKRPNQQYQTTEGTHIVHP